MHKPSGSTTGRLANGGIVIAAPLVLALAGCGGASTPASGQTHTASPGWRVIRQALVRS
jgi:hypothetical protein